MGHMMHEAGSGSGFAYFFDMWRPDFLLLAILIGYLFFRFSGRDKTAAAAVGDPSNILGKFYMVSALVIFYIGQGSPLAYYSHRLFSAHMLQQSLLYLVMPPLVYLAIPEGGWKAFLAKSWVQKRLKPLTHPLLTVFIFNALFSIYHVPQIFDAAYENVALHYGYHLVLILAAFHMWFPIFCPDHATSRLSDLQKIAYIVVNGILLTPACALIIFSDTLLYKVYYDMPLVFDSLSHYNDQQLGGTIMKIMQEIVYGVVLAYVFFAWYRKEKMKDSEEAAAYDAPQPSVRLSHH
ncbi:cytochrome c oxidase assembly protein [Gorillibacterium massiliense]|uniref:cytochrome c oxidase assembly protein n=1 Tax=Gorillibacterium massiliense TaxID=1280390 RepID=UPI0004B3024E|nr:cytochrome c oxidase assembly protein [Gorillibacterium massiliense]